MAAKGQSYAEKFSRWDLLVTNAKLESAQIPHLAEELASLEGLLTQVRAIESRQEDLRSQARGLNAELRNIAVQGEKLRARLGAAMQGQFGFSSEALVKCQRLAERAGFWRFRCTSTPSSASSSRGTRDRQSSQHQRHRPHDRVEVWR